MKRRIRGIAALLVISIADAAQAQPKIDIFQVWENFIASGAAASACGAPEEASKERFTSNLTDITIRAAQELQQRMPSAPPVVLSTQMKSVGDSIHSRVEAEVKQNGCSSPKIESLLTLYKIHSAMSF